ncbi:MAG: hypothetical protein M3203_09135, partial [Actinomycetota bacterium]|nr:hypothetical protein [Actinomycetota bacterium]
MVQDISPRVRRLALAVVVAVGVGTLALTGSSSADVTAVRGEAIGYYTDVSLFGGPTGRRGYQQVVCTVNNPPSPPGCVPTTQAAAAASPAVILPPSGGSQTQTKAEGARAVYGPAVIFGGQWPEELPAAPPSGPITTSCQGTTGPNGEVTCSVDITLPRGVGPGPFIADEVHSTCSARETDPTTGATTITGSTTIVNGVLETRYDPETQLPVETEPIPTNPPVNYTREGTIDHVGDRYRIVFNEQVMNPDGSLTVRAAHMYLLGPIAVGDMIVGEVTCGLATVPGTTTTTAPTTTTTAPTTTTT